MVTKTDRINGYLIAIIISLLSLTTGGIGWLIIQNHARLNAHDDRIKKVESDVNDLKSISRNLVEAYNGKTDRDKAQDSAIEKQRDEILELWKCARRSGSSKSITIKE